MPRRPAKSKLYTRTGDKGQTALFGGKRVPKDHPRVVAYGTIDELNSALGAAASFLRQRKLVADIRTIQNELFDIGAELASERPVRRAAKRSDVFDLDGKRVERLEALTDTYDARVPPLRTFILPSGSNGGALLHVARAVCRRAERELVTLARKTPVNPNILAYVNRLNDLLFAMARYANKASGRPELTWNKDA
jgi:cob(I)alamin adenosyltransferase